jgi:hypothetical protein
MSVVETALRPRRRLTGWKLAAILLGILALIVAAFSLWIDSVARRRWAETEKRVHALLSEIRGRDAGRPVLRGSAVEGDAWEEYDLAIDEMQKIKTSTMTIGEYVSRGPKADRASIEKILAVHGAAIDHLRLGARRSRGQYPYRWEEGAAMKTPPLLRMQSLANLATCQARFLAEAGKPREAAELLLDTCQFGRDAGTNGPLISEMVALAILGVALDELRDLLQAGRLDRETLESVGRELELLDRSFPRNGHSLINDAAMAGATFLKSGPGSIESEGGAGASLGPLFAWRFGFSQRIMSADAFDTMLRLMNRTAELEDRPWEEARRGLEELRGEAERSKNWLVRMMIPGLLQSSRPGRERKSQLRILRVAVRWRATGEILDLDDPFGTKLRHSASGGTLKVWSLGRDGADDGGAGGWNPPIGKDIVLEIPR